MSSRREVRDKVPRRSAPCTLVQAKHWLQELLEIGNSKKIKLLASAMDNLTPHKASEYDRKVRQTIPFYERIHSEVIRLVKVIKPDVLYWLDTGCGTGHLAEQALALFPGTRFILADPSEPMLAQARTRFAGTSKECVMILPATDSAGLLAHTRRGSAEVITAVQCHHYLHEEGRFKALQACFESLSRGGLFVTFENVAPSSWEGVRFALQGWKSYLMAHGRTAEEADKHLARYGTEFFPITVAQHLEFFTKVGFSVAELFWFSQVQAGFYAIK
jgi:tRNA (cmo5U34)-methyltransferase